MLERLGAHDDPGAAFLGSHWVGSDPDQLAGDELQELLLATALCGVVNGCGVLGEQAPSIALSRRSGQQPLAASEEVVDGAARHVHLVDDRRNLCALPPECFEVANCCVE